VGSGAYVKRLPGKEDIPGFNISAFELTEARLLFEGEAAALAATTITEEGLAELAALVEEIERENRNPHGTEKADRAFHLAIARATRNAAVAEAVERLWDLRADLARKRAAARKGPQRQHQAGGRGTHRRSRSPARPRPAAARAAMRTHLASVLDSLLFATEEKAIAEARRASQARRDRYESDELNAPAYCRADFLGALLDPHGQIIGNVIGQVMRRAGDADGDTDRAARIANRRGDGAHAVAQFAVMADKALILVTAHPNKEIFQIGIGAAVRMGLFPKLFPACLCIVQHQRRQGRFRRWGGGRPEPLPHAGVGAPSRGQGGVTNCPHDCR
jgi:GntR family transcriptional repressor for pyruvate dehydrogenase complex